MAWLNAQGNPVAVKPLTIQVDAPSEAADETKIAYNAANIIAILMAGIQLFVALKSGDEMAIAAAMQALIKAFTG